MKSISDIAADFVFRQRRAETDAEEEAVRESRLHFERVTASALRIAAQRRVKEVKSAPETVCTDLFELRKYLLLTQLLLLKRSEAQVCESLDRSPSEAVRDVIDELVSTRETEDLEVRALVKKVLPDAVVKTMQEGLALLAGKLDDLQRVPSITVEDVRAKILLLPHPKRAALLKHLHALDSVISLDDMDVDAEVDDEVEEQKMIIREQEEEVERLRAEVERNEAVSAYLARVLSSTIMATAQASVVVEALSAEQRKTAQDVEIIRRAASPSLPPALPTLPPSSDPPLATSSGTLSARSPIISAGPSAAPAGPSLSLPSVPLPSTASPRRLPPLPTVPLSTVSTSDPHAQPPTTPFGSPDPTAPGSSHPTDRVNPPASLTHRNLVLEAFNRKKEARARKEKT